MRHILHLTVLTSVILMATLAHAEDNQKAKGTGTADEPNEITWLPFDQGLSALKADSTDKHMFIDFTASWCGWCKKMEREAFADPKVIRMVNKYFIPVKVWGDSNNMLDIEGYKISERNFAAKEFKATGYPTFWFLSPEEGKIGPLRGYQTTPNLIRALTYVKDFAYDSTRTSAPQSGVPSKAEKTEDKK